jgi:catechol 2,3-dioxygenase
VTAAGHGGARSPAPDRPRLPPDIRIGRVALQVAELERSLGFYCDVIGFRELERAGGVARLGPREGPVLLELAEEPGVRPVPRTGLMGIYHFALLLPDRSALGRFVRHHVRRGTRFGAADHAFSEALYLEDPDGITIEVYADRPADAWPGGDFGGLPLVSDPLDASGLMAAAGEDEWAGVPGGSVIGHMHFFVDDLDAAAAFYVRGLGFEPMITIPSALFVSAGGYHHHVGLNTWRAGAPVATARDAKLVDWELVVPDAAALEGVMGRLEEAGFPPEPIRIDHGAGTAVVASDPWGITARVRVG